MALRARDVDGVGELWRGLKAFEASVAALEGGEELWWLLCSCERSERDGGDCGGGDGRCAERKGPAW